MRSLRASFGYDPVQSAVKRLLDSDILTVKGQFYSLQSVDAAVVEQLPIAALVIHLIIVSGK